MKINRIIPYICTGLIVVAMVFCSELLKEHEIIFPEIAFLTGCAIVGAACRWIVNIYMGFSLTVAACVTIIIVLYIVHITKMYMPPAGAITILSILIPAEAVTMNLRWNRS